MSWPSAIALEAWARTASIDRRRPAAPSRTLNRMGSVMDLKPRDAVPPSSARICSSSSLRSTGEGSDTWRAASGAGSRRLPSGPMDVSTAITMSSRMASMGGLVTWAKSCLK